MIILHRTQAIFLLLSLASLTLSGCGGGGGASSSAQPTCVTTSEGCLTTTQYKARVQSLKTKHTNDAGFSNNWGLDTINAAEAWAKLEVKYGAGTEPGDGVTLGVIDSGIDANQSHLEKRHHRVLYPHHI